MNVDRRLQAVRLDADSIVADFRYSNLGEAQLGIANLCFAALLWLDSVLAGAGLAML